MKEFGKLRRIMPHRAASMCYFYVFGVSEPRHIMYGRFRRLSVVTEEFLPHIKIRQTFITHRSREKEISHPIGVRLHFTCELNILVVFYEISNTLPRSVIGQDLKLQIALQWDSGNARIYW